ncbi:ComEA family DNA-binding protein [Fidelibacter multiformis]|jgi:competence ComEA-like helix-hairpin-helix protein|uniref:ComEA family DNA-binding protein n=1 Tax=Fidelibacter multiformis TaxID=3377529 RepID=UPI0037DC904D
MLNNIHKKIVSVLSWTLLAAGVLALFKRIFHGTAVCGKAKKTDVQGEDEGIFDVDKKVNINSADVHELATLPYVSLPVAQNIVNYRELNGSFSQKDELLNVKGIGPKLLGLIEEYICVE